MKVFVRAGFVVDHQTGSHTTLYHTKDPRKMLSVPRHRVLKTGTLRTLIRLSGMTVEQFLELL
ncbi:MAG TPA: type II toxin-antitoxin system HicA family toxin [Candidatus Acidoferrales bacterium]